MTTAPPPALVKPTAPAAKPAAAKPTRVIKDRVAKAVAPRIIMCAVEGFGKTSFAAYAPKPLLLMARGETGYDTLLAAGRVPSIPAEIVESAEDLNGWLDYVIANPTAVETLILDAFGGYEKLVQEDVCKRLYSNDWSDRGFRNYMAGYTVSAQEWLKLLAKLDRIHELGITIVVLSHITTKATTNPLGINYQKYASDVHEKVWDATARWADEIWFGHFFVDVQGKSDAGAKSNKAKGGTERHVHTGENAVMPSKSRHGLEPLVVLPSDPALAWGTMMDPIQRKAA